MMKIVYVFIMLSLCSALCAFEPGTVNFGGSTSYSSMKADADAEAMKVFILDAHAGYFFSEDMCVDFVMQVENSDYNSNTSTDTNVGVGMRYFYRDQFYVGPAVTRISSGYNSQNSTGFRGHAKAGFIYPVAKEIVYIDLTASYSHGIGDFGGDSSGSNKTSMFRIGAGLEIFFDNFK